MNIEIIPSVEEVKPTHIPFKMAENISPDIVKEKFLAGSDPSEFPLKMEPSDFFDAAYSLYTAPEMYKKYEADGQLGLVEFYAREFFNLNEIPLGNLTEKPFENAKEREDFMQIKKLFQRIDASLENAYLEKSNSEKEPSIFDKVKNRR